MAIPEAQLDTWSKQGSVAQSSNTYAIVKAALESAGSPYASKDFSIFLQGSYANDVNIYADSDVDIVIRLDSSFYRDLSNLTVEEQAAYRSSFSDTDYGYQEFKTDVLGQLTRKFGPAITPGNKAICIEGDGA